MALDVMALDVVALDVVALVITFFSNFNIAWGGE
jgi:hypothetical protein